MKLLVAIPAYNEDQVIGGVIDDIKKEGYKHILVVDDASSDDTAIISAKRGAQVLKHRQNKGAGGATRTALRYAFNNDFDFVVLMDADGQHDPKDIAGLTKYKDFDVVLGYRKLRKMPFTKKIANITGNIITWIFFGLYVKDSQSGFKMLNKKAMSKIKITFERYEFCSEIIGEIKRNHLRYKQVPIKTIYTEYSEGKRYQNIFNGFKMVYRIIQNKLKK